MKKKISKRPLLLIAIVLLTITIFIVGAIWYKNPNIPEPTNTRTLSQGTSMHFGELSIGLSSVNDKSALLAIHKKGLTDSVNKSVTAGDKIVIYGYTISVSLVKKPFNPSILPGSSHGYVKFTITSTNDWTIYTNTDFGFSIKYPPALNLTPRTVDIQKNYQEYVAKCNSGIYKGCGGLAWPDYKITFFRPNGKGAFDVNIWKGDIAQDLGGIEHNNLTYAVSTFRLFGENGEIEAVDKLTLDQVFSTLKFIN